jgi:hypothetical protein
MRNSTVNFVTIMPRKFSLKKFRNFHTELFEFLKSEFSRPKTHSYIFGQKGTEFLKLQSLLQYIKNGGYFFYILGGKIVEN